LKKFNNKKMIQNNYNTKSKKIFLSYPQQKIFLTTKIFIFMLRNLFNMSEVLGIIASLPF